MSENLAAKKCVPCEGGVDALSSEKINEYLQITPGWESVENHHIKKHFTFKDFKETLDFVNKVADIAEEEGHHPDICFTYGKADISIFTHAIDGLHENDFILAAKINRLK